MTDTRQGQSLEETRQGRSPDGNTAAELAEILPGEWRYRGRRWQALSGQTRIFPSPPMGYRVIHGGQDTDGRTPQEALRRAVAAERVSRGQADPGVVALAHLACNLIRWLLDISERDRMIRRYRESRGPARAVLAALEGE